MEASTNRNGDRRSTIRVRRALLPTSFAGAVSIVTAGAIGVLGVGGVGLVAPAALSGAMAAAAPPAADTRSSVGGAAVVTAAAPRSTLRFSWNRLVFSAVGGSISVPRGVWLRNTGKAPVVVTRVAIGGADSAAFRIVGDTTKRRIAPGARIYFPVRFAPAQGRTGAVSAVLFATPPRGVVSPTPVAVAGVAARGKEGVLEPPLAAIVAAFGWRTNVGGTDLALGTSPVRLGDEVNARAFRRAGAAPVTLSTVARYSPEGRLGFGWYRAASGSTTYREVGALVASRFQQVLPPLVAGGTTATFDPGTAPFGLWLRPGTASRIHLDSGRNTDPSRRTVRVWPVRGANGAIVRGSFLVGFEEASNGDYQDALFRISGVVAIA